ncbi:MAG: T9SS type A sorting domain-containing protein [Candidatus Latescibacterota bacterium]
MHPCHGTARWAVLLGSAGLLLAGPAAAQTSFVDATAGLGFPWSGRGMAVGDYDNDGWPDMAFGTDRQLATGDWEGLLRLVHNEGDGTFAEEAADIQADFGVTCGGGTSFGDYDNDGDLDLYVPVGMWHADWAGPDVLLRNDRGTFTDVTRQARLDDAWPTDNAIWLDYDRDGFLDLYTGNLGCDPARPVPKGATAMALTAVPETFAGWRVDLTPPSPIPLEGYAAVHCAVHPGDATGTQLILRLGAGQSIRLVGLRGSGLVDLTRQEWQAVEVPLSELRLSQPIAAVQLSGSLEGTLYLDDLRLVAARPSAAPGTAVTDQWLAPVPRASSLSPGYPNPFNGTTVLRFSLREPTAVELAVYSVTGQRVAVLVSGERPAGEHAERWDAQDAAGRPLASGVYLCRLVAGGQTHTRRMALVR